MRDLLREYTIYVIEPCCPDCDDDLRALELKVHRAARYLEHYENMYGGNDDE